MDDSVLRALRGKPVPRDIAVIDIEARNWIEPYAVGVYDGETYRDFVDYSFRYKAIGGALKYVLTPAFARKWIYAHNGGNYDFTFLFRHLICDGEFRQKYHLDITPIGSSVVCFEVSLRDTSQQGLPLHKDGCSSETCKGCQAKRDASGELKWTFVDSVKLMPMPLRDVCNTLGGTKKVELKMSYYDLSKESNTQTMKHYLKVDCISLHGALVQFQKTINGLGGQVGITLPSTSLDLFRRRFQKSDIMTNRHWRSCPEHGKERKRGERAECSGPMMAPPEHDVKVSSCLHDFIRASYFGGRTEIYRTHLLTRKWVIATERAIARTKNFDDKMRLIATLKATKGMEVLDHVGQMKDINSHYPHCMLEPMPVGPAIEMKGLGEADILGNMKGGMVGIVDCDVYIPEDCYLPPLPVREGGKGNADPHKLIFPTGYLRGTWDAAELALVPKVGGRILCSRRSVWFAAEAIFAQYVRTMYKYRDKSSPKWTLAMDWIAKLCLNSLYGKYAMRQERSKIVIGPASPVGMRCISFEADAWAVDTYVSPSYIVPQLSVHVTAIARARLWEILNSVIAQGGRIYYTDTDSVVCSGVDLPVGGDLGALKHEATVLRGEFILPKLYLLETEEADKKKKREAQLRVKAKGMGPGIRMSEEGDDSLAGQLSEEEFMDLVKRGVPIERHRLTKLREALNDYARNASEFPRIIGARKEIISSYDKRSIMSNGDTRPKNVVHFS